MQHSNMNSKKTDKNLGLSAQNAQNNRVRSSVQAQQRHLSGRREAPAKGECRPCLLSRNRLEIDRTGAFTIPPQLVVPASDRNAVVRRERSIFVA